MRLFNIKVYYAIYHSKWIFCVIAFRFSNIGCILYLFERASHTSYGKWLKSMNIPSQLIVSYYIVNGSARFSTDHLRNRYVEIFFNN